MEVIVNPIACSIQPQYNMIYNIYLNPLNRPVASQFVTILGLVHCLCITQYSLEVFQNRLIMIYDVEVQMKQVSNTEPLIEDPHHSR